MAKIPGASTAEQAEARSGGKGQVSRAISSTGLRQTSGYIREEFLRELVGRQGRNVYDEMASNDSTCGGLLFAIKNVLRGMDWTFESADDDDERSVEARDMLEGALLGDMSHTFPEFIESVCSMFTYGFHVCEVVWKRRSGRKPRTPWASSEFDDGLIMPSMFKPIGQKTIERWIYDDEEHLLGLVQYPWHGAQITVPLSRCMHFSTTAELGNPEGRSLLRSAYRSWYWLKRLQEIEGIGTERDLAGYPVLRVPGAMLDPSADADTIQARSEYEAFLQQVRRDQKEGVLLPSDRDDSGNYHYEFELMSSGGSRQLRIDESITRYQKDIARSVLADFIFLGADGGGSLALGTVKIQFFVEALNAYAKHIAAKINETVIPKIWAMNGLDIEIMPTVKPSEIEEVDLSAMGTYLKALSDVGYQVGADTALENHMRTLGGMPLAPEVEEGDDFFSMPSMPAPTPSPEPKPKPKPKPEPESVEDEDDGGTGDDVVKAMRGYLAEMKGATDE